MRWAVCLVLLYTGVAAATCLPTSTPQPTTTGATPTASATPQRGGQLPHPGSLIFPTSYCVKQDNYADWRPAGDATNNGMDCGRDSQCAKTVNPRRPICPHTHTDPASIEWWSKDDCMYPPKFLNGCFDQSFGNVFDVALSAEEAPASGCPAGGPFCPRCYHRHVVLFKWRTDIHGDLPTDAMPTAATLILSLGSPPEICDNRNLVADWRDDWVACNPDDYDTPSARDALSVPLCELHKGVNILPLMNAATGASLSRPTALRLLIDGEQPTGTNALSIAMVEGGPSLEVYVSTPTPAPAPPVPTATMPPIRFVGTWYEQGRQGGFDVTIPR